MFATPGLTRKCWHHLSLTGALLFGVTHFASAQTPAFPGALGFGQSATGGRGGTVYHVTTLADSGTGSFRDAVSHGNRIIVFDVGGTITLSSSVSCSSSLTIAGQTAPGGGIAIIGHEVSFSARTNEIVRYLRIRPGSMQNSGEDAINVGDGTNMVFDHCSLEFAGYNNIDAHGNNGSDAITVQNSIIGDPMYNGTSDKQGFGAHTEHIGGNMAWYYNLWVSEHNRQPLAKIDTIFVNNTEYNFQAGYTVASTSGFFNHDIINNYFITGPTDPTGANAFFQMNANQSIYSPGNLLDNNNDGVLNGSPIDPGAGGPVLTAPWSPLSTNCTVFSTATAARYDISWAGVPLRDQIDALIISQIQTLGNGPAGTGAGTTGPGSSLYFDQTSTGLGNNGYGIVSGGIPALDSDGDGMPDYWEQAMGLNYLNASDATAIAANGYANIENYFNWLADPHAMTITNTPVDVDLWQFTAGFTNVSPTYAVSGGSNGVVTLTNSHFAHFAPTANFVGLGSFQFSVVASDAAYTNTVNVLVTPASASPGSTEDLTWVGDGVSNLWAVGNGTNWFDGTNLVTFNNGDTVTFDDTGSNTPPIQLSGLLAPANVYVIADNQDYTFSGTGSLTGGGGLFKVGAGNLFINTTNNYSGGTEIDEGTVQLGDGVSFSGSIGGPITNNDTLIFDNPGTVSSSAGISGSGVLIKNGAGAVTLSGAQTYTNTTTINAGSLQFSGTLPPSQITDNGALALTPGSSTIFTNAISGSGGVATGASGVLNLTASNSFAGNLTNNSGFLVLSNNNAAGLGSVVYNGGFVVAAAGMVITNNFSIPAAVSDLSMMATNSGTAVWAGNVVLPGGGASWRPGSDGGTLSFTGTANLGTHNFIVPRGGFQIASNAVISTTGTTTAFGRDGSAGNRSANITIRDYASVTVSGCSLGGGDQGGNVTLTIQNNAVLNSGTNMDLNNVNRSTAQTFLRLNGGTFSVGGFTKTKTSQTNMIQFNGGVLKASANNASFLPAFTVSTNIIQSGGAIIDDGGFAITIAGKLIHDASLGATIDGGLTKLGAGALTLTTNETYIGPTVINAGALALGGNGSLLNNALSNTPSIFVNSGAVFDVSGTTSGSFVINDRQLLWGNGGIRGNFTIGGAATLSPGSNSIGSLLFNNSLGLALASTSIFEISHSPLTNDSVTIFGVLTNGGRLVVTNIGGSALAAGDTFNLFNAGSYTGSFSSVLLPPLPVGLAWKTNSLNTTGVISVVSTAPPTPPSFNSMLISGSNFIVSGTGGVANLNFVLLGSTNLATPISNWTPLLTNQFDTNGNFNLTNPLDPSAPQSFYLLQMP